MSSFWPAWINILLIFLFYQSFSFSHSIHQFLTFWSTFSSLSLSWTKTWLEFWVVLMADIKSEWASLNNPSWSWALSFESIYLSFISCFCPTCFAEELENQYKIRLVQNSCLFFQRVVSFQLYPKSLYQCSWAFSWHFRIPSRIFSTTHHMGLN